MSSSWVDQNGAVAALLKDRPETVADVVTRLHELGSVLSEIEGRPEPLIAFNHLYERITSDVLAQLENGGFVDAEFMTALDLRFAAKYLDALQFWIESSPQTPQCWSLLFSLTAASGVGEMQGMTAGVACHVLHDLSIALAETFVALKRVPGPGRYDLPIDRRDYDKLNAAFFAEIPGLRRSAYTVIWQTVLDAVCGNLDDSVDAAVVTEARSLAWDESCRLWNLRDDQAAYREYTVKRDVAVTHLERIIFTPVMANVIF